MLQCDYFNYSTENLITRLKFPVRRLTFLSNVTIHDLTSELTSPRVANERHRVVACLKMKFNQIDIQPAALVDLTIN